MRNSLPKELDFINKFRVNNHALETASWRISSFDSDVWECRFGTISRVLDFNKKLDDGSLLTDPKNKILLNSIKKFFCLQTHPTLTGVVISNTRTEAAKLMVAIHIVDYFLLRSDEFRIAEFGFNFVTANDLVGFIEALTTSRSLKDSIYQPAAIIQKFLEKVYVEPATIAKLQSEYPYLFEIDTTVDLLLSEEQTNIARAWLKLNDFYVPSANQNLTEYRHNVSRQRLLDLLIGTKTIGMLRFMELELPGLDLRPYKSFSRELTAVPVKSLGVDERASIELTQSYITILKSMRIARQHGIELIPDAVLDVIDSTAVLIKERTKERARFTTLPFQVANELLSNAIGFYLENGTALVDTYLALASQGKNPEELDVSLPPKLRSLGINSWQSTADNAQDFFMELRAGESFFNMIEVLWGAIAIIVATLTARRKSELVSLTSASIVNNKGEYYLAFDLSKANVLNHRKRTLRPIPKIVADALKLLSRLNQTLSELGYKTGGFLFEVPYSGWNKNLFFGTCLPDLGRCYDRFCDYHQTGLDEYGRRYYVRTHQLRRNFAMLFFWRSSFGGIEVLRHFLGHSKPSMTYRYITEATPGKVLRRIKATVAQELVQRNDIAVQDLSQLLCERYGISIEKLYILPEADVVAYIEDLLDSGEAEIEPEFYLGKDGEDYKITYKIKQKFNG